MTNAMKLAGLLVLLSLLSACTSSPVVSESMEKNEQNFVVTSPNEHEGVESEKLMKLYVYEDTESVDRNRKVLKPRKGYFVEFSANASKQIEALPIMRTYQD